MVFRAEGGGMLTVRVQFLMPQQFFAPPPSGFASLFRNQFNFFQPPITFHKELPDMKQASLSPPSFRPCFFAFMLLFMALPFSAFAQDARGGVGISVRTLSNYALKEDIPQKTDGEANPGEALYLDIGIKNSSPEDLRGLEVSIAGADDYTRRYATIRKDRATLGALKAGAETSLTGSSGYENLLMNPGGLDRAFYFSINERCPPGSLAFAVQFKDSEGKAWADSIAIPVVKNEGETNLAWDKLSVSLHTKVLEGGAQPNFSAIYQYAPSIEGELRLKYTEQSDNETEEQSLMANDEETYETFLLPFRYSFFNTPLLNGNAAAGLYYEYNTLKQQGYYNYPELGDKSLNIYNNDFSMHLLGPLVEAGLRFEYQMAKLKLHAGVVPIFYLRRDQSMGLDPYMGSGRFDHSQDTSGSPYFYGELNGTFFRLLSLSLLYDYARINYDVIAIHDDGASQKWAIEKETLVSQSMKLEAAILLPLGGASLRVGYGHKFDTLEIDSSTPYKTDESYLIIGMEKSMF
jgi:hypothetical protein